MLIFPLILHLVGFSVLHAEVPPEDMAVEATREEVTQRVFPITPSSGAHHPTVALIQTKEKCYYFNCYFKMLLVLSMNRSEKLGSVTL